MPIEPKFDPTNFPQNGDAQERPFTNRDRHLQTFTNSLTNQGDEHQVLVFHGIGGIGKSRLSQEFVRMLEGKSAKANTLGLLTKSSAQGRRFWGRLDFENTHLRNAPSALFALRSQLGHRYGFQFPAFDLAYESWWSKTHPQISISNSNLPFIEQGDFLLECVDHVQKILDLGLDISGLSLLQKVTQVGFHLWKTVKEKRLKNSVAMLRGLTNLNAYDIEKRLPGFWAYDFKEEVCDRDRQAVLFLDAYEALRNKTQGQAKQHEIEAWVREWIAQLPDVLWVITGREKLTWKDFDPCWSKVISQHQVGDLDKQDILSLLDKTGIGDEQIQESIVSVTGRIPYEIDLAIDLFEEITARGETPTPEDFDRNNVSPNVHSRFFKYLDDAEVAALEMLAVPRTWDQNLYRALEDRFDPGLPVALFRRLEHFSFVKPLEKGQYTLHRRTRDALLKHWEWIDPQKVHEFLFDHYTSKLEDLQPRHLASTHEDAFTEAFHHGSHVLTVQELTEWFNKTQSPFNGAARWRFLETLHESLLTHQENELDRDHLEVAKTLNNLAGLLDSQGRYTEAKRLVQRSLEILENEYGADHHAVAKSLTNLAGLLHRQGCHHQAKLHVERSLQIFENQGNNDTLDVASSQSILAGILCDQGHSGEAKPLVLSSLRIREDRLGLNDPSVASSLNNLADVLHSLGRYQEAEPLARRSLQIFEDRRGPHHPDVATFLKTLANLLRDQGRNREAKRLVRRRLQILKETLGSDHSATSDVRRELEQLKKVGHDEENGQDD